MSNSQKPGQEMTNRISTAGQGSARDVYLLTMIVSLVGALAAIGLFVSNAREPSTPLRILAVSYALFTGVSLLVINKLYPKHQTVRGLVGIWLALGLTLLITAALLSDFGFPAAAVFLVFTLNVSTFVRQDWQADLLSAAGIIVSGLCALLTGFSPFTQLSSNLANWFIPVSSAALVIIYIAMLATQIVTATLRARLGIISLAIAAIPLALLPLIRSGSLAGLVSDPQRFAILLTALVLVVVGLAALGAARFISQPVIHLAGIAQRISQGDPDARASEQSSDEFGRLGAEFNAMTSHLRKLISRLEAQVESSSQEIEKQSSALSHRTRQFEIVSNVARQIVAAQSLDTLLASVAHLISERFGFYHVGIFLLDENNEYAVLRAANSEGGQHMLARHHMLPVGKVGIVGYVTGTGQARIATDVGEDAVFFNNPDLPETRSEMALPLLVGETIIGALDIQSTTPNAFQAEDIDLFKTLSDQVAIAIHNNRLYIDTLHALQETESLHRQYLRGEWAQDASRRKALGYVYNQAGVSPLKTENPLWKEVFSSGEAVYRVLPSNNGTSEKAVMAIPIALRGETIGVIQVQDQSENRLWSEEEIAMVNNIASQVAIALENARLFESTVRRAEREKKALEITAKIRSTSDPQEMMKIAVSELQQSLRATRTQIYIRQTGQDADQEPHNKEEDSPAWI